MSAGDRGAIHSAHTGAYSQGHHIPKRIAVCCDGTWQDGITVDQRWKYTNVLKLARAIDHTDMRSNPPVPQVVFYQSGVGTFGDKILEDLDGAVGASLGDKVQEAYAFIAHNYAPGDEIFLFGFSRGAYTARMVAELIGGIGVLDRTDMDAFADIFVAYQKRGSATDPAQIAKLDAQLAPWTSHDAKGKQRAYSSSGSGGFVIKCVGVFDTVGSLGLPEEITHSKNMRTLFGFKDLKVGMHVENAYQALALDEHRADFTPAKWEQLPQARQKGQVLKQCWFAGSHSDIGGGWQDHDLSDLTLTWLTANIESIIYLDHAYLKSLPEPCAPWGGLSPHDSATGIYKIANKITRQIPTQTNDVSFEYIHPSVLRQPACDDPSAPEAKTLAAARAAVDANPSLLWTLLPLEEAVKDGWAIQRAPSTSTGSGSALDTATTLSDVGKAQSGGAAGAETKVTHLLSSIRAELVKEGHTLVEKVTHTHTSETTTTTSAAGGTSGRTVTHDEVVARAVREGSMGALVREIVAKWDETD